jgi:membrane protein DedA with SNARE-associated domain
MFSASTIIGIIGLVISFIWGRYAVNRLTKKLALAKRDVEETKRNKENAKKKDARVVKLRDDDELAERLRLRNKPKSRK